MFLNMQDLGRKLERGLQAHLSLLRVSLKTMHGSC